MGNYDNSHPTHYVRNFFICLWAIIVSLAFAGLFCFSFPGSQGIGAGGSFSLSAMLKPPFPFVGSPV